MKAGIEIQASAYTKGTEIYVGPGQEKYLPPEAWHVVQRYLEEPIVALSF